MYDIKKNDYLLISLKQNSFSFFAKCMGVSKSVVSVVSNIDGISMFIKIPCHFVDKLVKIKKIKRYGF